MEPIAITKQDLETKDHDALRNLVHFLHGRPDTDSQIHYDKVIITLNDLKDLNAKVAQKLRQYQSQDLCNVTVTLDEERIKEFASWEAFLNHDWNIHLRTESIILAWDFFINLPQYAKPQRHKLTVKILSEYSMQDVMQMLFDKNAEPHQNNPMATIIARVDFIDPHLGQELLSIVKSWKQTLKNNNQFYFKITKYKDLIVSLSKYSIDLAFLGFYFFLLTRYYAPIKAFLYFNDVILSSSFVLLGLFILRATHELSEFVALRATKKLITCTRVPHIRLTRGDQNATEVKSKKQISTILRLLLELLSGVIANIIVAILFKLF